MEFTKEQVSIIRAALGWHGNKLARELGNVREYLRTDRETDVLMVEAELKKECDILDSLMEHFTAIAS